MPLPKIYIDESGNTGSNIIDRQQKYFTLAAVNFTDAELQQLYNDLKVKDRVPNASELHFIKLRNSIAGRQLIQDFMSHPLADSEHILLEFVDKEYAVFAQMVDILVEPFFHFVLHEDLYRCKGNILMTNALYAFAVSLHTPSLITQLKEAFVDMVRNDDADNKEREDEFYGIVHEIGRQSANGMADLMGILAASRQTLPSVRPFPNYALDTTMTSFVTLTAIWGEKLTSNIHVITDDSKQLCFHRGMIENLCQLPDKVVGYDTRKQRFPLPIDKFEMVASDTCFGVQIADLVASIFTFAWNEPPKKWKEFHEKVNQHPFMNLPCYSIRYQPLTDSDMQGGDNDISPVDFLIEHYGK